jgi:hypothetical protein
VHYFEVAKNKTNIANPIIMLVEEEITNLLIELVKTVFTYIYIVVTKLVLVPWDYLYAHINH